MVDRRLLVIVLVLGCIPSLIAQEPKQDRNKERLPPPRTHYMGREIAPFMRAGGAPWLIRANRQQTIRFRFRRLHIRKGGVRPVRIQGI